MNFWTYFLFLQLMSYFFVLLRKVIYPFYKLRPILTTIGKLASYVHETAHFLMAKLMGVQVRFKDVNYQRGSMIIWHTHHNQKHDAFLKGLFIAFAPGLLSTIGIIRVIEYFPLLTIWQEYLLWGVCLVTLFWAVGISKADIICIGKELKFHPGKAIRQLLEIVLAWTIYIIWFDFFTPLLPSLQYLFEFVVIVALVMGLEFLQSVIKHTWRFLIAPRDRTGTATEFAPHITRKMNRQYAKIFFAKPSTLIDSPEDLP